MWLTSTQICPFSCQAIFGFSHMVQIIKYYDFMLKNAFPGEKEVDEQDDIFILVAPQNAVGNCIIDVRSHSLYNIINSTA